MELNRFREITSGFADRNVLEVSVVPISLEMMDEMLSNHNSI